MLRTCEDLLARAERAVRCLNGLPDDTGSVFVGLMIIVGVVTTLAPPNIADAVLQTAGAVAVLVFGIIVPAVAVLGGLLELIVWIGRRYWRRSPCRECEELIALHEWDSMHPACLRAFLARTSSNEAEPEERDDEAEPEESLLQDLDNLPTLDDESLDQTELAVIKDWTEVDPELKARVAAEGPEVVGILARRHVAHLENAEIILRAKNPGMHPMQARMIVEEAFVSSASIRPPPQAVFAEPAEQHTWPTFYYVCVRGRSPDDRALISGEGATYLYVREDDALSAVDDADRDAQRRADIGDPTLFFDVREVDVDHLPTWATTVRDDVLQKHRLPAFDPSARRRVATHAAIGADD